VNGFTPKSRFGTRRPEPLDSDSPTIPSTADVNATLPLELTRDVCSAPTASRG